MRRRNAPEAAAITESASWENVSVEAATSAPNASDARSVPLNVRVTERALAAARRAPTPPRPASGCAIASPAGRATSAAKGRVQTTARDPITDFALRVTTESTANVETAGAVKTAHRRRARQLAGSTPSVETARVFARRAGQARLLARPSFASVGASTDRASAEAAFATTDG